MLFVFVCLFEWMPYERKESGYSIIRVFASSLGLALMKTHPSRSGYLVRAGATGACAPTESWQRVPGTRPEKGAISLITKNAPKLRNKTKLTHLPRCK